MRPKIRFREKRVLLDCIVEVIPCGIQFRRVFLEVLYTSIEVQFELISLISIIFRVNPSFSSEWFLCHCRYHPLIFFFFYDIS